MKKKNVFIVISVFFLIGTLVFMLQSKQLKPISPQKKGVGTADTFRNKMHKLIEIEFRYFNNLDVFGILFLGIETNTCKLSFLSFAQ